MTTAAVTAINRSKRLALLDSGDVVLFEMMLDIDGDVTNDPDECFVAILQLPCGRWAYCDLREYEDTPSH